MIINDIYGIIQRDKVLRMKIIYVELGLQISSVMKQIKRLKQLGFITVEKKSGVNVIRMTDKIATDYDLLMPKAQAEKDAHDSIFEILEGKVMTAREVSDKTGRYQAVIIYMLRKMARIGRLEEIKTNFEWMNGGSHHVSKYTSIIN